MIFDYDYTSSSLFRFLKYFNLETQKSANALHFYIGKHEFVIVPKKEHSVFIIFLYNNKKTVVSTTIWKCVFNIYRIYFQEIVIEELLIIFHSFGCATGQNRIFSLQLLVYFSLSTNDLFYTRQTCDCFLF